MSASAHKFVPLVQCTYQWLADNKILLPKAKVASLCRGVVGSGLLKNLPRYVVCRVVFFEFPYVFA